MAPPVPPHKNATAITSVQLHGVKKKFNFFKNFKKLVMGGHNEKIENFRQIEKNR